MLMNDDHFELYYDYETDMSKVPTNVCKITIQQEGFENVHKCQFCQKQPKHINLPCADF